ncbi:MAG: hypothetical protein IAE82_18185 [Opitutaceae bacterium]|nr:hypothetical protein [Opitutaceae bacterium]
MTALLRKELRLLAPGTVVTVLAAGLFAVWPDSQVVPIFARELRAMFLSLGYIITIVAVANASVGREIDDNTLAGQLVLPVERRTMWQTKALTLAGALLLCWLAWWLAFQVHSLSRITPHDRADMPLWSAWIAATAFAGGLAIPLLVRQSSTAFAVIIAAPALVAVVADFTASLFAGQVADTTCVGIALAGYTIGAIAWSYRLFTRAEDIAHSEKQVAAPRWMQARLGLARILGRAGSKSGSRRALIAKELRFFEPVLLLGALFAIIHLGLVGARTLAHGFKANSTIEFISSEFWNLWLVLPLLLGAMAVADERRYGTHQAQLCLPVSRRTQFFIKIGLGATLALLFGAVLPHLIEGGRRLPELLEPTSPVVRHTLPVMWSSALGALGPVGRFVAVVPAPIVLFGCGFFASSLTRHVMRALGLGVVFGVVMLAYPTLARDIERPVLVPLWSGLLIHLIALPASLVALVALARWNFNHPQPGWPQVRRNLATVGATLVASIVVTTVVYQRAWEYIMPLESQHGAPRIGAGEVVRFEIKTAGFITTLADGRTAVHRITPEEPTFLDRLANERRLTATAGDGPLPDGAWKSIVVFADAILALDQTGRLWVNTRHGHDPESGNHLRLDRYDASEDWTALAQRWDGGYAVKRDGTFWRVCSTRWDRDSGAFAPVDLEPRRLGGSSDWSDVGESAFHLVIRKQSGALYISPPDRVNPPDHLKLEGMSSLLQPVDSVPALQDGYNTTWRAQPNGWAPPLRVALTADGSLETTPIETKGFERWPAAPIRSVGAGYRWTDFACAGVHLITLRDDGTLWVWTYSKPSRESEVVEVTSQQLSRSSDWTALVATGGGVAALAADGSIWHWIFETHFPREPFRPLIRVTRRPELIANIFAVTP